MVHNNMTLVLYDFNDSALYNEDDKISDGTTIHAKIFGFIIYFFGCLGIFSIFGVIHYERFGQDPQKRSFADLIFTFNCKMFMIFWTIFWTISQIRWIFGPVGYNVTILRHYVGSSLLCIPLGFTEGILFRFLMIYSWKKCAMINDEFCAMFFNTFNFMLAQMISVIRLMTGQFVTKQTFTVYSGVEVNVEKPRSVKNKNMPD